ncbi:MAG: 3-phosphoshikimate 1-carboxyvinyltransferase [Clostridia bacterium]|nr:3-phosphoshikimate 1-carboxyvinyltransferase [Clostridia bacterium]
MDVIIEPSVAKGNITAPPSKSYAHRMMICAALAKGESTVAGISQSQDMLATLNCIKSLGVSYSLVGDVLSINGYTCLTQDFKAFDCNESGSTLRFFIPLSLLFCNKASFTGTQRLLQRGIGIYEKLFKSKGINVDISQNEIILTGSLSAGEYELSGNISSQFVSGLMFALPLLDGESTIKVIPPVESRPYIDITIDVLSQFGIKITEQEKNVFKIAGGQSYQCEDSIVEGDWSNSCFFYALNSLGADIHINGLNHNSLQGDRVCIENLKKLDLPNQIIDISDCPDLAPVLFATAAAKNGATFIGTKRLKIKESDRASVMAQELKKFGIKTDVLENKVIIHKGILQKPCVTLDSHNDHRIVMAEALLACITGAKITGAEAVKKSYPDFFDKLQELGVEVRYELEN